MNLNLLKRGEIVLLDANILIYAIQQQSVQCKNLLMRCAEDEISCIIPAHILAEVMHILMIAEAKDNAWIIGPNPARQLSEKPDRVKALSRYESLIKDILALNLTIASLEQEDFPAAMRVQRETGLMTNDALLVAVADRLRVQAIASADKLLLAAKGKMIYVPTDL